MFGVFVFVGSDVSGCSDEDADDDASLLEESVALEPVVELDSDRCFLLLFLDSAVIMINSGKDYADYCFVIAPIGWLVL